MIRKKRKPTVKPWRKSAFVTWFEAQFGKNPYHAPAVLLREIEQTERHLRELRFSYERSRDHETRRDAALKAWCARDEA